MSCGNFERGIRRCCITDMVAAVQAVVHAFVSFCARAFEHAMLCLQCFDAVGWAAGRASGL